MNGRRRLLFSGVLFTLLLVMFGASRWAGAQVPTDPYLYFPSAGIKDTRMLSLSSTDIRSLAGESLEIHLTAPADATSFELGIFDGDTGRTSTDSTHSSAVPHWDLGSSELEFTLEADIEGFRTVIGQWRGNDTLNSNGVAGDLWTSSNSMMPDNDWWNVTVQTSDDARMEPTDPFHYVLTARMLDTSSPQQVSNFKLRTTATFSFRNAGFGVEAAFRQVNSDGPIIYPGWNPSAAVPADFFLKSPTTYNGTFSFFVNVEAGSTSLAIFDGDLDYGTNPAQLTGNPSGVALTPVMDADDPDTLPGERPAGAAPVANNEGAAGMGVPADDINFDRFRRSPAPYIRVIDPDGNIYLNNNPSGNLEWERFRVAKTGAFPANQSDYTVDNFAAGVWRIDVHGMDMANLSYFHFNEDALGVPAYLIGDTVFYDNNGNGVQDAGDPGINNVLLNLRRAGNAQPELRAVTNAAGYYDFPVQAGTWLVEVDPRNFQPGGALYGLYGTTAGPIQTNTVTNANILTYDFGFNNVAPPQGINAIGDFVWHDLNHNGIQDAGEPGIDGVTVQLLNAGGTVLATKTTAADPDNPSVHGFYLFDGLNDGTYAIKVVLPGGYLFTTQYQGGDPDVDSNVDPTTGKSANLPLAAGENDFTVDAGLYRPVSSLGDFVWNDLNRNGVQDAGEPGLAGVTVTLLDGSGNPVGSSQITGSTGAYLFSNLNAGSYKVQFTAPAGYVQTGRDLGGDDTKDSDAGSGGVTDLLTLAAGTDNRTVDAGFYGVASLGDFVWNDVNRNGIQDGGEPGLAGVTVKLLDAGNNVVATASAGGNGLYGFGNLAPGAYRVQFTPPAGYAASPVDAGGDDTKDSDNNGGTTGTYTLAAGDNNLSIDAGFYAAASLGDLVWNDLNRNGVQDAGEPGIGGVTVKLLDSGNNVQQTTTTDGSGLYSFTNLAPGSYKVQFTTPAGYVASPADQGGDDTKDSDSNGGTTGSYTLAAGDNNTTVDAGFYGVAALGDFVWNDVNRNGVQDGGEAGLSGVTVKLLDSGNGVAATATTNGSGLYAFTNLAPGTYRVQFVTPAGYTASPADAGGDDTKDSDNSGGTSGTYTLAAGDNNTTVDAGFYGIASLGDFVWNDLNRNGVQDNGEAGLSGVTVKLLDAGNNVQQTVTTNGNGAYAFTNLAPGSYKVQFTTPAGYVASPADQGGDDTKDSDSNNGTTGSYTLAAGDNNLTVDAGFYGVAALGDFVWNDVNRNGVQDGGEAGLSGVTVKLLDSGNGVAATATTNGSGAYSFTNLAPGTYRVQFVTPAGYAASPVDAGGDDAKDSDSSNGTTGSYTLAAGDNNTTVDAGFYGIAGLGDFVWNDANTNGLQDNGEAGISGVTVKLLDANNNVLQTTTTDGSGLYSFSNLAPGTYKVQFVLPSGKAFTTKDAGDDTKDSDADTTTGITGSYTLAAGDNNTTVDAGLKTAATPTTASLGDYVWFDTNRNGLQDSGEPGLSGATVELRNSGGTVIATAVTDSNGAYLFSNLAAGNYSLRFYGPSGLTVTTKDAGGDDTKDSDIDTNGYTPSYTLAAGQNNLTVDAGYWGNTGLGDYVWNDLNRNGVQDANESGISGVTVKLLNNSGTVLQTTTTNGNGAYSFTGLAAGTYKVQFVAPSNFVFTTKDAGSDDAKDSDADPASGITGSYTLSGAGTNQTVDAGFYQVAASVGDFVWEDTDRDGVQDAGEPGVSGITVVLKDSNGNTIATTTTDSSGYYLFTNVPITPVGSFRIYFTLPTRNPVVEWTQKDQGDDAKDSDVDTSGVTGTFSLSAGQTNLTFDAGIRIKELKQLNIGDQVWLDSNGNGVYEPQLGEIGINGVTVRLVDYKGNTLATTTTGNSPTVNPVTGIKDQGYYLFANVPGGRYYQVRIDSKTLPSGLTPTYDLDGTGTPHKATLSTVLYDRLDFDFGYKRDSKSVPGVGTPGYWKNHSSAWPVSSLNIGGYVYTKAQAIAIIGASTAGDVRYSLAQHLISAKVNVADGNPCPSAVSAAIANADAWLAQYGKLYPIGSGTAVGGGTEAWSKYGNVYLNTLADYNNGKLGVPHR